MKNTALTKNFNRNNGEIQPLFPSADKELLCSTPLSQNASVSDNEFADGPTLTFKLPDERYRALVQRAMKEGCTVEILVERCIHTLLGE